MGCGLSAQPNWTFTQARLLCDFCVQRAIPTEARGRGRESPILGIVALSEHSFVFLSLPPVYLGFLVYPAECSEVPYKLREKSGKAPLDARVRLS